MRIERKSQHHKIISCSCSHSLSFGMVKFLHMRWFMKTWGLSLGTVVVFVIAIRYFYITNKVVTTSDIQELQMELSKTIQLQPTSNFKKSEYVVALHLRKQNGFIKFPSQEDESYCDGSLLLLNNGCIFLRNLILDPSMVYRSLVHGGERLSEVLGQNETEEFFHFKKGYFQLMCRERPKLNIRDKSLISKGLEALQYFPHNNLTKTVKSTNVPTFMIERMEYSNLYHAMTEWYNLFTVLKELNLEDSRKIVLFVDKHPRSSLDDVWKRLFGQIEYAYKFSSRYCFLSAVWLPSAYQSLMNNHRLANLPSIEHFRSFFLNNFSLNDKIMTNCEMINITFIWRRDYVFHARNHNGTIQRKFANEDKLLSETKRFFQSFNIVGVQLEKLSFTDQLSLMTKTSILIAMHGAGLTHVLFLPRGAGVFEIFPKYVNAGNGHFRAMARWRKLHYVSWRNYQSRNEEENFQTRIPPEIVISYIRTLYSKMFKRNLQSAERV